MEKISNSCLIDCFIFNSLNMGYFDYLFYIGGGAKKPPV